MRDEVHEQEERQYARIAKVLWPTAVVAMVAFIGVGLYQMAKPEPEKERRDPLRREKAVKARAHEVFEEVAKRGVKGFQADLARANEVLNTGDHVFGGGRYAEAVEFYQEAIAMCEDIGDRMDRKLREERPKPPPTLLDRKAQVDLEWGEIGGRVEGTGRRAGDAGRAGFLVPEMARAMGKMSGLRQTGAALQERMDALIEDARFAEARRAADRALYVADALDAMCRPLARPEGAPKVSKDEIDPTWKVFKEVDLARAILARCRAVELWIRVRQAPGADRDPALVKPKGVLARADAAFENGDWTAAAAAYDEVAAMCEPLAGARD